MNKRPEINIARLEIIFPKLQRFFHNLSIEVSRTGEFTIAQYRVLSLLDYHGEMTVNQLKNHLKIAQSTASGIVDRLVQSGYLKKSTGENDKRITNISLTPKAKKLLGKKMYSMDKVYREILNNLEENDQSEFVLLFEKLMGYVEKIESNRDNKGIRV